MRVLLIYQLPADAEYYGALGLACLAACLEDIAEVRILEIVNYDYAQALAEVERFRPHLVGISVLGISRIHKALELAARLKQTQRPSKIILGGHGATCIAEEVLHSGLVDAVVRGEGERTLREIVTQDSFEGITGVSYVQQGAIIHNPPRPLIPDLDTLPFPARRLLAPNLTIFQQVETSRGCPFRCSYCETSLFYGHRWRAKSPERVLEELKQVCKDFDPAIIFVPDDNFTVDMDRVVRICELILRERLPAILNVAARADDLAHHPDVIPLMARAGFRRINIGVESANSETLRLMRKGIKSSQVRQAVKLLDENGIYTTACYILGYPNETSEMIQTTIDFAVELNTDSAGFTFFQPIPGTEMYAQCEKEGRLLTRDWSQYNSITPLVRGQGDEASMRATFKRAQKRFYIRSAWIAHHLTPKPNDWFGYRSMLCRKGWVALQKTWWGVPDTRHDWLEIWQGYSLLLEAWPDTHGYSARVGLCCPLGQFLLTIDRGRLKVKVEDEQAGDLMLAMDDQTLRDLWGTMELDLTSAFVLGRVTTEAPVSDLVPFIDWMDWIRSALKFGVRPTTLDLPIKTVAKHLPAGTNLQCKRQVALKTSHARLLLEITDACVVHASVVTPASTTAADIEIEIDDSTLRQILSGSWVQARQALDA